MSEKQVEAPVHEAGEAGSGTVPGDRIGAGGVTGGTGAFGPAGGIPPRSPALGTRDTVPAEADVSLGGGPSGGAAEPGGEGALGQTRREHSVVPEAEWGKTSGAPSGGIAGGAPAQVLEDEAA